MNMEIIDMIDKNCINKFFSQDQFFGAPNRITSVVLRIIRNEINRLKTNSFINNLRFSVRSFTNSSNNDNNDVPKKKPGRPKKDTESNNSGNNGNSDVPKKKPGRPKKDTESNNSSNNDNSDVPKKKPGRPKKDTESNNSSNNFYTIRTKSGYLKKKRKGMSDKELREFAGDDYASFSDKDFNDYYKKYIKKDDSKVKHFPKKKNYIYEYDPRYDEYDDRDEGLDVFGYPVNIIPQNMDEVDKILEESYTQGVRFGEFVNNNGKKKNTNKKAFKNTRTRKK